MKKIQLGFFAAVLLIGLSITSCTKDVGQICFPVNTVDTYEIYSGETLEIDMTIENLMDGELTVEANCENPFYGVSVSDVEGDNFKLTVNAPDFIKEQTEIKIPVKVSDVHYDFREPITKTITVIGKPDANLVRVAKKANSLICEPGKIVCFKAFKGNSGDAVDFDEAYVIWQDKQNLVSKIMTSDDEIVAWLTDGVRGNALVGAFKNDKLVWTYHLWVISDDPAEDLFEFTAEDGTKYSFIDRNLGAIDATADGDVYGLYYFWGNRHPYAGGETALYDIDGNTVEYSIEATAAICAENSLDDIFEYSLTRPLTMFSSNDNKNGNYEWLFYHKDKDKWTAKADLWGGVSGTKSIYDPCPEGYKVPSYAAMNTFKAANATQEKQYNGEVANKNFVGWGFTNDKGGAFIPAAGDYNNTLKYEAFYNGENTWPTTILWAADMQIDNFRATCLKGTPTSIAPAGQPMGYLANVRCIKE